MAVAVLPSAFSLFLSSLALTILISPFHHKTPFMLFTVLLKIFGQTLILSVCPEEKWPGINLEHYSIP